MLIASLVLIFNTTTVTAWARKVVKAEYGSSKGAAEIDQYVDALVVHVNEVGYALLVFSLVLLASASLGWCYRNSTLDRTFQKSEKVRAHKEL